MYNALDSYFEEFNTPTGAKRKQIVEVLVSFFGEQYRDQIEKTLTDTTIVMTGKMLSSLTMEGIDEVCRRLTSDNASENSLEDKNDKKSKSNRNLDTISRQKLAEDIKRDIDKCKENIEAVEKEIERKRYQYVKNGIKEISEIVKKDIGVNIKDGLMKELDMNPTMSFSLNMERLTKTYSRDYKPEDSLDYITIFSKLFTLLTEKSVIDKNIGAQTSWDIKCAEMLKKIGYQNIDRTSDEFLNSEIYKVLLSLSAMYPQENVRDVRDELDIVSNNAVRHIDDLDIVYNIDEMKNYMRNHGSACEACCYPYMSSTGLKTLLMIPYGYDTDEILIHELVHALGTRLARQNSNSCTYLTGFSTGAILSEGSVDEIKLRHDEHNIFNEIVTEYLAQSIIGSEIMSNQTINGGEKNHVCRYSYTMYILQEFLDCYLDELKDAVMSDDAYEYMCEKVGKFDMIRVIKAVEKVGWLDGEFGAKVERLAEKYGDDYFEDWTNEKYERVRSENRDFADKLQDIFKMKQVVNDAIALKKPNSVD